MNDSSKTTFHISAGVGYKYHIFEFDQWTKESNKVYQYHSSFIIDFAADFWGGQKHFIGIELLGYPYTYGDHQMAPKYFTIISNFFYRRNIAISKRISLFPSIGLAFFSNDANPMFTLYLDAGIKYDLVDYEIFIKNSFRFSPFMLDRTPWISFIGISIKI